ncbi:DNA mismatch repair protein [Quillaja saponaria]|uniref:DNA mismatch repair protein n=1 Tax=Quillaja saponaria TaxID=32244 RepID=A0AAD7Q1S6_QUISA|nr:DNA mismatch repair protein [Quillaja saponaria]
MGDRQSSIHSAKSLPSSPNPALLLLPFPSPSLPFSPSRSLTLAPSPTPLPLSIPSVKSPSLLLVLHRLHLQLLSFHSPTVPAEKQSYGQEVVGKTIKVYWPLDKAWYHGCVKSFDKDTGKHLVQYDDAEEELLDLAKEKIELVEESGKKLKRLRRGSSAFKKVEVEDEEVENVDGMKEESGGTGGGDDDSSDEDWRKNEVAETADDGDEDVELDLEDEAVRLKGKRGSKVNSRKRKMNGGGVLGSAKKSKSNSGVAKGSSKATFMEATCISESKKASNGFDNVSTADASERFAVREAQKLWFLGEDRRDAKRRHPEDESYDPRTLYLPPDFLKSLSGGQRQWWEFKSKHMDKVLFFKMGKFYELFEMDAHIGAKELDLQYMKGEQPHCGFPERNFSMNVEKLARKGYRVLVVEQTETPEQMELRRKEDGSKDKVVKREVCAVVTKGTLTEEQLLVILGQFRDDSECSALCSILSELRPVEIVKPAKLLSAETERNIYKCIVDSHVEEDGMGYLPEILVQLVRAGENGSSALSALGGALFYLKQAFLDDALLRFGKFELLPCFGFNDIVSKPYMVLDAAALENLEIFENSRNGDSSGTLYAQLNHCVTAFGKRLLKTWLARPLYHLESIRERQEAVAGLRGANLPFALEFRKALSRLSDMERLLARIFSISEANGRNANKVVLYEDASKKKLQEFIAALRGCELMAQACSSLGVILENVKSRQLRHLLSPGKVYQSISRNNENYLETQSISYVTIGKEAYLLEVPESSRGTIPQDYELRSSKKGFFRYWTPDIKQFLGQLSQAGSEKESSLKSILHRLIGRFCEHHMKWRQLVSATAELDVLISLAITSDYYEGQTCRPNFSGSLCENEVPCLSAKCLGHPVLRSDSLGKGTFVSNDIAIGGPDHASFILLTGPNMGGKSTLLRQVCLAVISAQVGADVPAESFELSPVDRIFVRMGAKDNIMAGQSTFLTELSETATMLSSATHNSLVALDELGRGTSTSDGQAIAESVLEHFVRKGAVSRNVFYALSPIGCRLSERSQGLTLPYGMSSCYGVNVARLAGLPSSVLQKAAAKSREFEATYGRYRKGSFENCRSHLVDEMGVIMQKLFNLAANLSSHESFDTLCIGSLSELQHKAGVLLQ